MRKMKELWKTSLKSLKSHFFINVIVVFIVGFILNGGYHYASNWNSDMGLLSGSTQSNIKIIEEFVKGQDIVKTNPSADSVGKKYTRGYFSVFVNEVTQSGSLGFGILNGVNKIIFHDKIAESVTIFCMTLLSAFVWIFVKNIFIVGRCRYFLEHRLYGRTKADRLLFVYRTGSIKNCAKVMLLRSIRQGLWDLTIIGGVIKYFEYRMIPYILAENPSISSKDAFALSKQLADGNKLAMFQLNLTLFPFMLLDGATFHLSSLFFLNPFRECAFGEVYADLRKNRIADVREILTCDELLFSNKKELESYPDELCPTHYREMHHWLSSDWNRAYGGNTIVLFFFFFSLIGWVWEVIFYLVGEGSFINRGTMLGPWLPIYGVGGWIIIYGLRPLRKNPTLMFMGAFTVCGIVEYGASWLLEKLFHQNWWDYTGYVLNLNGRICLEGLLVFGMAGVAMTYFIAPIADNLLLKLSSKTRKTICIVLSALFLIDLAYSAVHPNIGNGITEGLI